MYVHLCTVVKLIKQECEVWLCRVLTFMNRKFGLPLTYINLLFLLKFGSYNADKIFSPNSYSAVLNITMLQLHLFYLIA